MVIGYLCEGWDHRIVHCLVCRLLGKPEGELVGKPHPVRHGLGYLQVLQRVGAALKHFFYQHRATAVVVGVDNDGRDDLDETAASQSNASPRHWVHQSAGQLRDDRCRHCGLAAASTRVRSRLTVTGFVPGTDWPVIICVPVEAIEAWLLIARALSAAGQDWLNAERRPAGETFKRAFWGYPMVTESMVKELALPLLSSLDDVRRIAQYSRSFRLFIEQLDEAKDRMAQCARCQGETF